MDRKKGETMNDTLKTYLVTWDIEVDALTARGAAEEALRIHRDPESIATIFQVIEFRDDPMECDAETIDLSSPSEPLDSIGE